MTALNPQTSRYNPRNFLYFFAGSLTVIIVYVFIGHLPSRQTPLAFEESHSEIITEDTGHDVADTLPEFNPDPEPTHSESVPESSSSTFAWPAATQSTKEDGWYITPEENPYGKEGVDVSDMLSPEELAASNENMKIEHIELRSQMTKDGKWFTVDFVTQNAYNPGFLQHPYKEDRWVMFAQRDKSEDGDDIW